MAWIWITLALIYILSPYDLLPDFIPIRGWIDDIVVLILMMRYIMRIRRAKQNAQSGHQRQHDQQTHRENDRQDTKGPQDPYEVLGIAPTAKKEEIQSAYRKLVSQYHPDKVAHLGKEFQELAERRFKEIQAAYEKIARR